MRLEVAWAAAAAIALTGCMSYDVRQYATVDRADRTILVPAGGFGVLGGLKDALRSSGWTMVVSTDSTIAEPKAATAGSASAGMVLKDAAPARYKLLANSRQFDICITGGGAYYYDVTVIDQQTSSEVMSISGRGCEPEIVKNFISALNR